MKTLYTLLCIVSLVALSCTDDDITGPNVTDNRPPDPVQNIQVENLPGGANITYQLPSNEDLLMVEAHYQLDTGRGAVTKSSVYNDTLKIEGLRSTEAQTVQLFSIDNSGNKSDAVSVTIEPMKAPIDLLFESLEMFPDFGGVAVFFEDNYDLNAEMVLFVEQNGVMERSQSIFLPISESNYTFRSYDTIPQTFGVQIIDRWDNVTEIYSKTIQPLKETKLDKALFSSIVLPGDAHDPQLNAFFPKSLMWNDDTDEYGYQTADAIPGFVVSPYEEPYHLLSFDLGVTADLSRIKFFESSFFAFEFYSPRYFEIWGTNEPPFDGDGSLDNWVKIIEDGELIRPSGLPPGETATIEDLQASRKGHEFIVPASVPPVRYIRFVSKENWQRTKTVLLSEVNFWGDIQ